MRITALGVSGSFAGPQEATSSYLLQVDGLKSDSKRPFNLLIDFGSGAFSSLQRHLDPAQIDAVLISHLHADHFVDLSGLEVFLAYHPLQDCCTVPVYAPAGLLEKVESARGVPGLVPQGAKKAAFDFHEIADGTQLQFEDLKIQVFAVEHPIPAYGFRIEYAGKVLAYTGDTDYCAGALALAKDADLLIAEAGYVEGRDDHYSGVHLTGKRAGQLATDAKAKSLLLTHIPPWTEKSVPLAEAQNTYAGPLAVAEQGKTYEI